MSKWYLSSTAIDTSRYQLDITVPGSGTLDHSATKNTTTYKYWRTITTAPGNADWQTGAMTISLVVTAGNANVTVVAKVNRINAAGTVQESSAASNGATCAAGTKTLSIASKDWLAGATTDRLELELAFTNSSTSKNYTISIDTSDASTSITTSIVYYIRSTAAAAGSLSAAAAISGRGAIGGAAAITTAASCTLSEQSIVSPISCACAMSTTSAATITGTGTVSCAGAVISAASASIGGAGSMACAGSLTLTGSASIGGIGSLAASATITITASASAGGEVVPSPISCAAGMITTATAAITGHVYGTGSAMMTTLAVAAINGIGDISASASITTTAAASIGAVNEGALSCLCTVRFTATAKMAWEPPGGVTRGTRPWKGKRRRH